MQARSATAKLPARSCELVVIRWQYLPGRDYGWMDGYDPEVEQVLRSTLTSFRPDIVHVHHWHRLTNNLVAICADLGIPVVVTLHDVWTSCPRIHRIHREGLFCREPLLTAPCLHCVERTQWQTDDEVAAALALRQQMIGEELALASALIVPSEAHRSLLLQLLALPENRLTVLPHGSLQTLMAQERRTGLSAFPNRPLQIGHWGYFLYHKGTHLLLEALHRLGDPSAVQVHLIGTALDQVYGDRLHDLARGLWHPTPVLLPGKSHGWRSLVGCSPWGLKESDTTERLHFHFSLSCIGEGKGDPLQCSCLENPRDGRAWWAAIYGVTQNRTRLKRLSSRHFTVQKRSS